MLVKLSDFKCLPDDRMANLVGEFDLVKELRKRYRLDWRQFLSILMRENPSFQTEDLLEYFDEDPEILKAKLNPTKRKIPKKLIQEYLNSETVKKELEDVNLSAYKLHKIIMFFKGADCPTELLKRFFNSNPNQYELFEVLDSIPNATDDMVNWDKVVLPENMPAYNILSFMWKYRNSIERFSQQFRESNPTPEELSLFLILKSN